MKTIITALTISLFAATTASANLQCGIAPIAPIGTYPVCVCDAYNACSWVFIAK